MCVSWRLSLCRGVVLFFLAKRQTLPKQLFPPAPIFYSRLGCQTGRESKLTHGGKKEREEGEAETETEKGRE